jgi:peroxiredoxin
LAVLACLISLLPLAGCTKDGANGPQGSGASAIPAPSGEERAPVEPGVAQVAGSDGDAAAASGEASPEQNGASDSASSAPDSSHAGGAAPPPSLNDPPESPGKIPAVSGAKQTARAVAAAAPVEVYKPEVILSQNHAQTCVVGMGDPFPKLTLADLEGNSRELSQLYGERMTIVVFWTAKGFYAREQFARIMQEVQDRYQPLGVSVVAINVGDSPQVVQELAQKDGVTVPCLLDADSQAFHQVATDLLPRTYLLDAEGRILWFDLEYSRSQRQELHNAVHFQLKQAGA